MAEADNKRRAEARDDNRAWFIWRENSDTIGATNLFKRLRNGILKAGAIFIIIIDQCGEDFGIGVGIELIIAKALFELFVILDNTVMDEENVANMMRMGVRNCYAAVCGPARMADTDVTSVRFFFFFLL